MQNHWWQVVLYVTDRGLNTSPIPYDDGRTFEISFDFASHQPIAQTYYGETLTIPLVLQSVADFYAAYRDMLQSFSRGKKEDPASGSSWRVV